MHAYNNKKFYSIQCGQQARISSWLEQLREEFPQRRFFDPLVALSNGKRVCVTRLVGLIAVPFDEEQNTTEFLIRRFVSLVPLVRIGDECTKLNGVWLVNDVSLFSILQFLYSFEFYNVCCFILLLCP